MINVIVNKQHNDKRYCKQTTMINVIVNKQHVIVNKQQ